MHRLLHTLLLPDRERRLTRGRTLLRTGVLALGLVMARSGVLELARTSAEGRCSGALAAELGLSHEATFGPRARLERAGLLQREAGDRVRLPLPVAA